MRVGLLLSRNGAGSRSGDSNERVPGRSSGFRKQGDDTTGSAREVF